MSSNLEVRKTFRQRLTFRRCNSIPQFEALGFWEETIIRWNKEGLPKNQSPWEYFGISPIMDNTPGSHENPSSIKRLIDLVYKIPFYPVFEKKVIEKNSESVIILDEDGVEKIIMKDGSSMPQFLKFPVEDKNDWKNIKFRLNPNEKGRYAELIEESSKLLKRNSILRFGVCGCYGFLRNLFGEEKLAYLFYDNPELVYEIMEHWLSFQMTIADNICPLVDFDYVFIWEDLAFKTSSLISPSIYEKFMKPFLKSFIQHVKTKHKIDLFMVDSDGNNISILPVLMDAGINIFMPCEVAAGMEPLEIVEKFPGLAVVGGIDKREIAKGKKAIEAEIIKKTSLLKQNGGYIPAIDHGVPPDISFEDFCYYIEFLRNKWEF